MRLDHTAGMPEPRRRRRKTALPAQDLISDCITLFLLCLVPAGVIWVFGGNRFWIMAPAILLILLAALPFIFRFFCSPSRYEMVLPPGGLLIIGFVGYLSLIIGLAEIPYEAKLETFRYLSYAVAYWMWSNLLHINKRWKWALVLLMLSVSVMAWYALIQEVHGTNMVLNQPRPEQYRMRASGAYICPNHFANLLEMMIPICLAVVLSKDTGIAMRLVAGYTALISLPCLYLTESRSGWIGLIVGVVVFVLALSIRKGMKKFLLVLLVAPLLAGAAGVLAWQISPRVQTRVEDAIRGDMRPALWKDSLTIAQERPVIGNGLGSYRWMYAHFREHFRDNADPEFAHNDFLQFWAEIGAVGLVLILLVVISVVARSFRIIKAGQNPDDALLMSGLLGAMAGAFAHAFFDFNFHIFGNVHVFVFLLAALFCATYSKTIDTTVDMKAPVFRWIGAAMALLLIALALMYMRDLVSYHYATSAKNRVEKMDWDRSEAEYRKAIAWSSGNWRAHVGLGHLLRARSFWMRNPEIRSAWIADAFLHYEIARKLNPWEADILYGMGSLYKMQGDQEKALEYRRMTVEQVPRQTFYLNELGLQLKDMKLYEEAMTVFRESISVEHTTAAEKNIAWLRGRIPAPKPDTPASR